MRIFVPQPVVASVRALGLGQPGRGCLRVMAMWQPAEAGEPRAGTLVGQDLFWETVAAEGTTFDEGLPKPRGEFLLSGSAWSATPVTSLGVMVTLGAVKKHLQVFGERFWSGSRPSQPMPFTEMPITWERALGGPKDHRNYAGRGQVEDPTIGAVLLPNIELPQQLLQGPRDRPPPAGFGPRTGAELPRRNLLGTMDEAWIERRFPEMPTDFDPRYGQQACEDQWSGAHWRGDERFCLLNLHPRLPRWEGTLPGLGARAWVCRTRSPCPEEMPLELDTVWFFPRFGRIALLWRGSFELEDDDELEVLDVMAALEWRDQRRPAEHYAAARARRKSLRDALALDAGDGDLLPPELAPAALPAPPAPRPEAEPPAPLSDTMKAELTATLEAVQAELRAERAERIAQGEPTGDVDRALLATDAETAWEKIATGAEGDGVEVEAQLDGVREQLVAGAAPAHTVAEFDVSAAEAKILEAQIAAATTDRERRPVGPPPPPRAEEQLDTLAMLQHVKEQLGARYPDQIEAQIAALQGPTLARDLRAEEERVREHYRSSAHLQPELTALDRDMSAPGRDEVERAVAAGASLRRWDLTALDLSGLDFRGADLSEAWLESAVLVGARLAGCNLHRAVLTRADLTGADLTEATLTEANLGGADATQTCFTRAELAGAILVGTKLADASLAETSLGGVDLSAALLLRVSFARCRASGLIMTDVDLSGCDFREAEVVVSNFTGCKLHGADFRGARLERTLFFNCQGDDVDFSGAKAHNLRFARGEDERSSFRRANFRGAMLDRACLGDTDLTGAEFRDTTAEGAIFSSSDLTGARFDGVRLVAARFERAILRGASFVAADLMDAHLMRARCQGTDFRHANLFGINTLRIRLDERTDFRGANLEKVRFFQPVKETHGPARG
ncbi:MAG: DUF2169 domain-containing protein [Polyangiaceae bacterium]|nr:DUF2169 domain-containing protein [Polyangiaceae bacterium]